MSAKQKLLNLVGGKDVSNGYTNEFKEQIVEVYNSGVYAAAAECARSYKVPEKLFYRWLAASKKQTLE